LPASLLVQLCLLSLAVAPSQPKKQLPKQLLPLTKQQLLPTPLRSMPLLLWTQCRLTRWLRLLLMPLLLPRMPLPPLRTLLLQLRLPSKGGLGSGNPPDGIGKAARVGGLSFKSLRIGSKT